MERMCIKTKYYFYYDMKQKNGFREDYKCSGGLSASIEDLENRDGKNEKKTNNFCYTHICKYFFIFKRKKTINSLS